MKIIFQTNHLKLFDSLVCFENLENTPKKFYVRYFNKSLFCTSEVINDYEQMLYKKCGKKEKIFFYKSSICIINKIGSGSSSIFAAITCPVESNELLFDSVFTILGTALDRALDDQHTKASLAQNMDTVHAFFSSIVFDGMLLTTDIDAVVESVARTVEEKDTVARNQINTIVIGAAKRWLGFA